MKRVIVQIGDELLAQVDEAIKKWSFGSRAEFFRYAAIDFLRNEGRLVPSQETLEDHAKSIRGVQARRGIAIATKAWLRHTP